jgi:hypothetical protein
MKKCQAITKSGMECAANGAHIMMVWVLNAVAYPQDKLPALYAGHGWRLQSINLCGAHRNVIVAGKAINIQTSNTEVPNKPQEGNMTSSHEETNKPKADCPHCLGTGIDTGFWDACKCVSETPDAATDKQVKFITDLFRQIGDHYGVPKVSYETKAEASKAIDLLKQVLSLVNVLRNKQVTDEQKANIKAKLEDKPTIEWVKAATAKALTLPRKS